MNNRPPLYTRYADTIRLAEIQRQRIKHLGKPVYAIATPTKPRIDFTSVRHAMEFFGVSRNAITDAIVRGGFCRGRLLNWTGEREPTKPRVTPHHTHQNRAIIVGDCGHYESPEKFALEYRKSRSMVGRYLHQGYMTKRIDGSVTRVPVRWADS